MWASPARPRQRDFKSPCRSVSACPEALQTQFAGCTGQDWRRRRRCVRRWRLKGCPFGARSRCGRPASSKLPTSVCRCASLAHIYYMSPAHGSNDVRCQTCEKVSELRRPVSSKCPTSTCRRVACPAMDETHVWRVLTHTIAITAEIGSGRMSQRVR